MSLEIERTRKNILLEKLTTLQRVTRGVQASALMNSEGLPIVSKFEKRYLRTSNALMAGLNTALLNVGERALNELKRGSFEYVLLAGNEGYLILTNINEKLIFVVLTTRKANLGFIILSMKKLGEEILEQV
ncbi:MAG: roadblock/LC7 domain-containing protein [Candidatus Hodarchaeota archaeon]